MKNKPIARMVLALLEVAGGLEELPLADLLRLLSYVLRADRTMVMDASPPDHREDVGLFFSALVADLDRRARDLEASPPSRGNA